jgi:hypothetical protein
VIATYDRKHLLAHSETILANFGITVLTPDVVIASIREQQPE